MSVPLEPKPCRSSTIFLGRDPDRGFRLAPLTIFDNLLVFLVGESCVVVAKPLFGIPVFQELDRWKCQAHWTTPSHQRLAFCAITL